MKILYKIARWIAFFGFLFFALVWAALSSASGCICYLVLAVIIVPLFDSVWEYLAAPIHPARRNLLIQLTRVIFGVSGFIAAMYQGVTAVS